MQALSSLTFQCDITVAEDAVDEVVHRRLFKLTATSRFTTKRRRTFDFLRQEITNILGNGQAGCAPEQRFHSPTLPSSPQMNRPGTQLHLIFSQAYIVEFESYPG